MYAKTATGSIYEIDYNQSCIRRLSGVKDPTIRLGSDGEWHKFDSVVVRSDGGLSICWSMSTAKFGMTAHTTQTSPVVKYSKVLDELVTLH